MIFQKRNVLTCLVMDVSLLPRIRLPVGDLLTRNLFQIRQHWNVVESPFTNESSTFPEFDTA